VQERGGRAVLHAGIPVRGPGDDALEQAEDDAAETIPTPGASPVNDLLAAVRAGVLDPATVLAAELARDNPRATIVNTLEGSE
jgi:hypothetical protein